MSKPMKFSLGDKLLTGALVLTIVAATSAAGWALYGSSSRLFTAANYAGAPTPAKTSPDTPKADQQTPTEELEIIVLSQDNSVTLDSVYDDQSVQQVMRELQALSNKAPKSSTLYLILNTPGGSVLSGIKLISFIKALPQKVKTITIFAASMGFQTVQQLDERLIVQGGTLMSHPASFGVQGSTTYQVKSRYNYIMSIVDDLDRYAAARMNMDYQDYQDLVHDEYWAYDKVAVRDSAADRRILAKCGSYSKPTKSLIVATIFGDFKVEIPSCPIIPGYVSISAPSNVKQDSEVAEYVKLMFTEKSAFTKLYIVNDRYLQFTK